MKNVKVTFWPQGSAGQPATGSCDAEGRFGLRCPPGEYKVTIQPPTAEGEFPGPGGPLPPVEPQTLGPKVPESYRKEKFTPLSITIPGKGTEEFIFQVLKQGTP